MKRPQPDFGEIAMANYLQNLGFINKFIKLWGTTTIQGEEVLVYRNSFYKNMSEDTKKLTKWLKMYDDLTDQKMKGIRSAWLYLNPSKGDSLVVDSSLLAGNLTAAVGDGLLIDVSLQPKPVNINRFNQLLTYPDIVSPTTDQDALIEEIKTKFSGYYYEGYYCDTNSVDRYQDVVGKYLLITNSVEYEVKRVVKVSDYISVPIVRTGFDGDDSYSGVTYKAVPVESYKITLYVKNVTFNSSSDIVTAIMADLAKKTTNPRTDYNLIELKRKLGSSVFDGEGNPNWRLRSNIFDSEEDPSWNSPNYVDPVVYGAMDDMWVSEREGWWSVKWYLKVSALRDSNVLVEDRVKYLVSLIDVDYKEKSRSAWERLVAMVIIVAAIAFAPISGGTSFLVIAAKFILTVAFYVSMASIVMSKMGFDNITLSLNEFLNATAPLIKVAGIVAAVGTIKNVATEGAVSLAGEGATIAEVGLRDAFIEGINLQFRDLFTSSFTDISMEQITKNLNMVMDFYAEQDKRDLQKQIKREEAKIAEYEEAMEQSKTNHTLMDAMKSMYNPLTRDYSYYDNIYDRPYEWWATPYHTGCMQANGVSAFWTTDTKRDIV